MTEPAKPMPCPFCGEQPKITKHFRDNVWNLIHRCVVATIAIDWNSEEQIITRWNTRATDARLAQSEKAMAELRAIADTVAAYACSYRDHLNEVDGWTSGVEEALTKFTEWKAGNPE